MNPINTQNQSYIYTREMIIQNPPSQTNSYIETRSKQRAIREYNTDPTRNVMGVMATAIPIIDSISAGAMKKTASMATKVATTAHRAAGWGVFMGVATLYNKIATSLIKSFKPSKEFSEKNPGLTTIGVIGSGVMVANKATTATAKLAEKVLGGNPIQKLSEAIKDSPVLKSDFIQKKITAPASKMLNTSAGNFLKKATPYVLTIAIIKSFVDLLTVDAKIAKLNKNS